jgi:hypothetical protein
MLTDVDLPAPGLLWTRWATLAAALTGIGYADVWYVDERGAHHDDHGGSWARLGLLDGARAVLFGYDRDHSATAEADPPIDLLTGAPDWLPWDDLTALAEADRLGFVVWHDQGRWSRVRYRDGVADGLVDTAGARPPRIAPGHRPPMRRVRRLSHDEHDRLVWNAMHDADELRRPAPPATGALDALAGWMRERSPAGDGRCTVLVYADASSMSVQPGEHPPGDRDGERRHQAHHELTELARRLRNAEGDPRYGRWLFLRVETTATEVRMERRYDSWPDWWADDGVSGPWRTNLQEEMDARAQQWRPSWVRLLDPAIAYKPS